MGEGEKEMKYEERKGNEGDERGPPGLCVTAHDLGNWALGARDTARRLLSSLCMTCL